MTMQGFDPEFRDLPHYILEITRRIWEGRDVGAIRRFYPETGGVHSPMGSSYGCEAVVAATLATLHTFPDRRLLGEDVVWSGNDRTGFLSSHRLISLVTHTGDGFFGPPTGRRARYRIIADCEVHANRITEEWLVRDLAAIVQQLGHDIETFAAGLAAADASAGSTPWHLDDRAKACISGERSTDMRTDPLAADLIGTLGRLWNESFLAAVPTLYDEAANWHGPRLADRFGHAEIDAWYTGYAAAFPGARWECDHAVVLREPARPVRVSLRWRLGGRHAGPGAFGAATGATIMIMGISHYELAGSRILREFTLTDEVSTWKQIKAKTG